MAVQRPYREVVARDTNQLVVDDEAGRGKIITRISVVTPNSGFASVQNARTTVGYFAVGPAFRNHLANPHDHTAGANAFDVWRMWGWPAEIPVAEGDTLTIDTDVTASLIKAEYREVDPGDINIANPFGRQSSRLPLILYGSNAAAITAAGYHRINDSLLPVQLTQFPYEQLAEAGRIYDLKGIGALDVEDNEGGTPNPIWNTGHLRLTLDRETLFDPDAVGFATIGDGATPGTAADFARGEGINQVPFAPTQHGQMLFALDTPLQIDGSRELIVEQSIEEQTAGWTADAGDLLTALWVMMRPAGGNQ